MLTRRRSQFSSFVEITGRNVMLMRSPTSCVTAWLGVADMWQVAQVGAAE
jgi:hypothetical protein